MKHALRSALILVVLGTTPVLLAQISRGGMGLAGGSRMGGAIGHGGVGTGHGFRPVRPGIVGGFRHHGFHNNRFFSPFWSNAFWWDDGYSGTQDQVVVQQPVPVVVQQDAPVQEMKPANPLLIELQGDRFVRLTGNEVNPPLAASTARLIAAEQHAELPPALLVFRDGHRQEVSSYSIIGPALYASGSYWTNGFWTQKVLLADLDLPATLAANRERGVNFVLPTAPDQVVTRP